MSDGTTPPSVPAAGTLAADPAFAQFDAELQGAFKNKGWDAKPIAEAAREAMNSYREAERFVGMPKDQIVRLPKDAADEAGIKAFRTRIGVPEDFKGYDFSGVKNADGTPIDTQLAEAIAKAAHTAGVPKGEGASIAGALLKHLESTKLSGETERLAKLATDRDTLKANWGANMEANSFIVKQAALKLGLTEEIVTALEKTAGYNATMNAMLKIGQLMGEDRFVANPATGSPGVMSVDQAKARFTELKADTAWVTKLNNGDAAANRELDGLVRMIASGQQQ